MTTEQKNVVQNMRSKLYSYAEIADALGLPVNTIKSYCYRNRLNTEELLKDVTPCKNCGKPIVSQSKTKPRIFCSDTCKISWWKNHKEEHKKTSEVSLVCETCGTEFTAYKSADRKYCSQNCYQRRNCNGQT